MTGQDVVTASVAGETNQGTVDAARMGSDLVRNLVGEHTPDILDTLANLSNDEVFTPPEVANHIMDLLPAEVWTDPALRFLDPGVKTGVFLREAAKRLMVGLADAIPDEEARRTHIFQNMLYGLAITELTALLSRRTLYYTTHADDPDLSAVPMSSPDGNIHYAPVTHEFDKGSCVHCGASRKVHNRGEGRESHAYAFIHPNALPAHWSNMRFDVILGNPPYQANDGGGGRGSSATPLYHLFVQAAKALNPRFIAMIVPSRWFGGGKGLDDFREEMLNDQRISVLVDHTNASDCFPGVEIKGGVCYFLWDSSAAGPCRIRTMFNNETHSESVRALNEWDVLVRFARAGDVLRKVQAAGEPSMAGIVSASKPFGFRSNVFGAKRHKPGLLALYQNGGVGWIPRADVSVNAAWIDEWKVLTSKAYGAGEGYPHQITGKPFVVKPGSACTETYLVIGPVANEIEAERVASYLRTRFVRFLVSLRKNTQNMTRGSFKFVPVPDLSRPWTDSDLYAKYGLTEDEIAFIESHIKEMS